MDVLHARAAGLDVHQAEIAACVRVTGADGRATAQGRRFATTPAGLAQLRAWLREAGVTHVAMEGTGVYWMPVFAALEADVDVTLCNAHHVKQVPGRKTDQSDAAWLAQLLAQGLLRKSYVPPAAQRALRELTRARVHRVEDRTRVVNALHRLLEREGLKLGSVVSDLQGKTARAILAALADGVTDAHALAALARGTLRGKRVQLAAVLAVPLSATARVLLAQALAQLALLDDQIAALDAQLAVDAAPHQAALDRLCAIPGIDRVAAVALVAELGADVAAFDTAPQLAAWAGLAPGQRESAGTRTRAGTRDGNAYVRRLLVQVAFVLSRTKVPNPLTDFFAKKRAALGYKKAAVATAHKLLRQVWAMLRHGRDYAPPPPPPLSSRQHQRLSARYVARLQALGYDVTLEPRAA